MMPPGPLRPPSPPLPASMTAPVTGSVLPRTGALLCADSVRALPLDVAPDFCVGRACVRAEDDLAFAPADVLVRFAGRRAAGFFAVAVLFGVAAGGLVAAAGGLSAPAAGSLAASLVPSLVPRLELRRPGRERGRLPITPGSSGLMAGNIPSRAVSIPLRATRAS